LLQAGAGNLNLTPSLEGKGTIALGVSGAESEPNPLTPSL